MTIKGAISLILGGLGLLSCLLIPNAEVKSTLSNLAWGIVAAGVIEFLVFLYENRKRWNLFVTKIYKWRKPVRVTVAYLFRIEVNGEYMLIKRHKKDRVGYQPIGGAFKYFKEENRELFDKLGIEPCNHVPRDEDTEHDLRVIIRKRKHLMEFLKWFEGRKNREMDPWREFYEELIEPGFLPAEAFRHIKYAYIGKHEEGILPSPVFPTDEYRYAEIYELRPETDAQRNAIAALKQRSDEILFATPEEIRKGSRNGKVILPHTFKILPR